MLAAGTEINITQKAFNRDLTGMVEMLLVLATPAAETSLLCNLKIMMSLYLNF